MKHFQQLAQCALLGACAAGPVHAQVVDLATYAGWTAYGGRAKDGSRVCGDSAQGTERWFGMKYCEGATGLVLQPTSSRWKGLSRSSRVRIAAGFDGRASWSATAIPMVLDASSGGLQFNIPGSLIQAWIDDFSRSFSLVIEFPDHTVPSWKVDLDGTAVIVRQFGVCLGALMAAR